MKQYVRLFEDLSDYSFASLMAAAPEDLREYLETLKNVDQRRDRHPEGDVFTHTQVVTDRVAKHGDIDVSIAALLHDVAKDRTTEINDKTGMPMSPGHEKYAGEVVRIYADWIRHMGGNVNTIVDLVTNHMKPKQFHLMKKSHVDFYKSQYYWDKLKKLTDADYGGTNID